jgi:hypothetical protein
MWAAIEDVPVMKANGKMAELEERIAAELAGLVKEQIAAATRPFERADCRVEARSRRAAKQRYRI